MNLFTKHDHILKKILLLTMLLACISSSYSQELTNHAPVAPNSASLGSYGATPVGYYTGTAQVSIPVYTVKTNNLNFPIALNYHGDGLKVLSEATFVGLDWTLSNTGVITRTIEGLDDLSGVGYPQHTTAQLSFGNGKDPAPDIFYYNVNGHTGSFVLDYPGIVRLVKKEEDITVQLDADQNFKIITEEGTVYYFAKKEYQDQTLTISSSSGNRTINRHYLTAWYLSTVTSNTGEVMTFNYLANTARTLSDHQSVTSTTFTSFNITPMSNCTNQNYFGLLQQYQNTYNSINSTTTHAVTDEVLVDNITFSGGSVQFSYSDRDDIQSDLAYGQNAKKLNEIKVYDEKLALIKDLGFGYSEFYSTASGPTTYSGRRLRLDSFYESPTGTNPKLSYIFFYNATSTAPFPVKSDAIHEPFGYYSADPTLGLLTQIKYPTGGTVNFTYGSQGIYGARVEKIENRGGNNEVTGCRKLVYSGGKPITAIVSSYPAMYTTVYSCTDAGANIPTLSNVFVYYTCTNLNNFLQTGASSLGNVYGYDQVTELDGENGENGKTIYTYYNVADQINDVAVPTTHDQNDGTLLTQESYKNTGGSFSLLKKTVYTPLTRNQVIIDGANISSMGNAFSHYNIYSQEVVTIKEETWTYNASGTMYDATDYTYNPYYLQPATIQRTQSDGKVLTTVNRYAYDMTQISPYNDMVAAHMISQPIEVEKQLNGVKINRTVNLYSTSWPAFPGHVLPSYLQTQKSNNPTEDRIRYQDYDGYGNASSLSYIAGPKVAYIWGYNGLYPIAKAINTSPADIGFTNCEEPLTLAQTDKSGSNMVFYSNSGAYTSYDAHTGHKSFSLTNGSGHTISTRNTLLAGKYVFSYWSKGSTPTSSTTVGLPVSFTILDQKDQTADSKGWQYHEDVVNIPTSDHFTIYPNLSGADILIDDIRIYPLGAEMTTYTYDPLVGVTSMTDARNNTTYYEYDYFHRLSNVKDQNGNIKNRYCYNYAGQSMGCQIPFVTPTPPPSPDPPVGLYFRVEISNVNNEYYGSGDNYSSFQTGDVCIKLYSNPECTIPLTLPYDIPFVLTMGDNILDDLGGDIAEPDYGIFTLIAGNSSYCLGTMDLDNISHYIGSDNNPHYQEFIYHYDLTPGSNAYRTKPTVFN